MTVEADEERAVPMPMAAGDVLFFHCHTLHKSGGNVSGRDRPARGERAAAVVACLPNMLP